MHDFTYKICRKKQLPSRRGIEDMFDSCFPLLKIKNIKNLFEKRGVFLFFMFSVFSKITFFLNNKKMFSLFKE